MSDFADRLLATPRGRFFCAHVAFRCVTEQTSRWTYRPYSPADAQEAITGVDTALVADLSEPSLLDALSFTADYARYWQQPDDQDVVYAAADIVAALRPVARIV
ncbi:hypothetical protein AAFP35_17810 [Gordonia sp. CPCC 206044]|uniref:hypothetical protein n=1 Tax=Gordonia sp. CPCC 206044 TaxID=3140793 RepID=UPI003AF3F9AE